MRERLELNRLAAASRRLHTVASSGDLLAVAAEEARRIVPAHLAVVSLSVEGGQEIGAASLSDKYSDWRPYWGKSQAGTRLRPIRKVRTYRMTQAQIETHPAWPEFGGEGPHQPQLRGWLAAPLTSAIGETLGFLQLSDRETGEFNEYDELLLEQFAAIVCLALENRRHVENTAAAEARLRQFLDSSLDMVCTVTGDGLFHEVGGNSVEMLGYAPAELVGRPYRDFVMPDDLAATDAEEAKIRSGISTRSFTNRYVRADGSLAHLHWSCSWSEADQLYYCVVRDLTDQLELEARLHRAERMKAIGDLTGGVAHDFNNLLTIIIGSAEAMMDSLPKDPKLQELAGVTLTAAERGAELTHRLLAFARRQQLEPRNISVCRMLDQMGPLVRRAIGEDIEVSVVFEPGLACIADPGQLESALLNLCINARDAMPRGGKLIIEARALDLDSPFRSRGEDLEPGRYVALSVTDTGQGMSCKTASRAFEPFFTTKAAGGGTGLGLSMVYGFARQSGGAVKIYSELGQGTAVKLYLPRTAPAAEEADAAEPAPGRGVRILAVEDDPVLRRQVERQLAGLGYAVAAVGGGREAVALMEAGQRFDLVFTDVVMPGGISGSELGRKAQALQPGIQVLLTSGYSGEAIALKDGGAFPTLQKPYRTSTLSRRIEAALNGA